MNSVSRWKQMSPHVDMRSSVRFFLYMYEKYKIDLITKHNTSDHIRRKDMKEQYDAFSYNKYTLPAM